MDDSRGHLRIYLGAAPGVGKTFSMLDEGFRRRERGTDVVIGLVEPHGRARTSQQVRDLEVVPAKVLGDPGQGVQEVDVEAVLARRPEVVLVDDLAHTNAGGSRNPKRWMDITELLEGGLDVISTVNIEHLESLNDVVKKITGKSQPETVPDTFVRAADKVELVDMTPEALRRRMAHGNIHPPEEIDAALGDYFRLGNLTALRELALLWVVDQVDTALQAYRDKNAIMQPWETRERVAVALTGAPGGDDLVRRAARIASRSKAELIGIHIEPPNGVGTQSRSRLGDHRQILTDLGGRYREVIDADVGHALVSTAVAESATQLVLGASRRSRWTELTQGSVINQIAQHAGSALDIHIIASRSEDPSPARANKPEHGLSRLPRRRQLAGLALVLAGLPALTAALSPLREALGLASVGFCYLLAVVAIGTIGGAWVAALAAVAAFFLMNWFFADPIHTFSLANERDATALFVFLLVAGTVSFLTERSARRSVDAARARVEAETLATMAGLVLREEDPLDDLVAVLQERFSLSGVSVLASADGRWKTEAAAGVDPPDRPERALLVLPLSGAVRLAISGDSMDATDRLVIERFATQLAVAMDSRTLRAEASQAAALTQANELRDHVIAALGHDLRTPLATIKAAASSLLDGDDAFDPETRHELLAAMDEESDRLNTLVANLLDLGRLQADAVTAQAQTTELGEVIATTLANMPVTDRVKVDLDDDLPPIHADPVLLERALANLVANALRYSPVDEAVTIRAVPLDWSLELRVIDHGRGIPRRERRRAFQPFERIDDQPESAGTGLGLAVARGFIQTMGGALTIDETPGGGTTMIATLATSAKAAQT